MTRHRSLVSLAAALAVTASTSIGLAHHSTAIYDSDHPVELAGTVVEWRFTNPHCLIMLEVVGEDGTKTLWTLEGSNTAMLFRRGWTPKTLGPGDKIVTTVRPLRSGVPGGNYSNVRWENGTPVNPRAEGR